MVAAVLPALHTKHCPFCDDGDPAIDEIKPGVWAIVCNGCNAIGPNDEKRQTAETAIRRWNRLRGVK